MTDANEYLGYRGQVKANIDYHHGQLTPVVGVQSYQVMRANREHPECVEDTGWTYNHAPMLAYWNGQFFLEYLSNPVGEHCPPGQTLMTTSKDGRNWTKPQVIFPPYILPNGTIKKGYTTPLPDGTYSVMHQRMGFYTAPNGRFLVIAYYGISVNKDNPNDGNGIGRVVREVYQDGSLGQIYFVRYNQSAGWNESNTRYPYYKQSDDLGFIAACDALLADKLMVQQWAEECDRGDELLSIHGDYRAFCYYHLSDGRTVGLWKWSKAVIGNHDGTEWSTVFDVLSLIMAGAKIWGQRTADGKYALLYNPVTDNNHRWPLAIVTSEDGLNFDHLQLAAGDIPPRRYLGQYKDAGINYIRGIEEGNGNPPDGNLWVTYSMNKEDIWVTRIAVPVKLQETEFLKDDFNHVDTFGYLRDWNIYSPLWAPVSLEDSPCYLEDFSSPLEDSPSSLEDFPSSQDKSLVLRDRDPYDYAKAERMLPPGTKVTINTRVSAGQAHHGCLYIELQDAQGAATARVMFDADGWIKVRDGGAFTPIFAYEAKQWYDISISFDVQTHRYSVDINGKAFAHLYAAASVNSITSVVYRTGDMRRYPDTTWTVDSPDLPNPGESVEEAVYYVNYLAM